ncbi:hypothetical protein GCM10011533_23410 [Streptosporangium jomthongense]|nr:hypothetical protein GCM10011533_23410 [Streptosporangium jomthongense]
MKLAEIEIYWSFAIHSALTLSLDAAGPENRWRMVGMLGSDVRYETDNRMVQEGGHQPGSLLRTSTQDDESPIPGYGL